MPASHREQTQFAQKLTPGHGWPLVGRSNELELVMSKMSATEGTSVILAGPAGVGKSRLAAEILILLGKRGWVTHEAAATSATSKISLGPLAHLIRPLTTAAGHLDVLCRASEALVADVPGRQLALFVDDAHLLDDQSGALIYQIACTRSARLLLTLRSYEPAPEPITALWKDGIAARIDLRPLARAEMAQLVETVLGGRVDGLTIHELHRTTAGNVLFLRELIDLGLTYGLLAEHDEVWRWAGPMVPASGLLEVILLGSLAVLRPLALPQHSVPILESLAWAAAARGDDLRAARLAGAAAALLDRIGARPPATEPTRPAFVSRWRALLSARGGDSAWREGRAMGLGEAIAYALGDAAPVPIAPSTSLQSPSMLTQRQLEVARLVTQGLTNKEIASRLFISERTAEGHVDQICNRLGFNSRVQIAAWLIRHEQGPQG